jgi:hypothetical protein
MSNILKKSVLLVKFTLLLFTVHAQSSVSPLEDMVNAIKNNRVSDMVKYFDSYVPITINYTQSMYSHNQAEIVLKDFFDKNVPKNFNVLENGAPDNTSKFLIGNFDSQTETYNVYILMKLKNNVYLVQELRLNKQ